MWIIEPPSSTIRRASAAYSSGVYGIAGHWSRLATAPEIEQVMMAGSSKRLMSLTPRARGQASAALGEHRPDRHAKHGEARESVGKHGHQPARRELIRTTREEMAEAADARVGVDEQAGIGDGEALAPVEQIPRHPERGQ